MITPEDEKLYKLAALPDPPFMGAPMAGYLNRLYEKSRKLWRMTHPIVPSEEK